MDKLNILKSFRTYREEKIEGGRYRLSKIIREYDNEEQLQSDLLKLLFDKVTEEELYSEWKREEKR